MPRPRDQAVDVTCEVRFGGIKECCARYSLGKDLMFKVCKDAGATIRVGRRLIYDFAKIDEYLSSLASNE